jgi:uncharacterized cupin superfamily protein
MATSEIKAGAGAKTVLQAIDLPPRAKRSILPEPFAGRLQGRLKRQLGEAFGLRKFGVNLTELEPGGQSALLHRHSKQEEFFYVLEGTPTLVLEDEEIQLAPGDCAGFPPKGRAHMLVNRTDARVLYLEVGDREQGDEGEYPNDDLRALQTDGKWVFTRKDGTPY